MVLEWPDVMFWGPLSILVALFGACLGSFASAIAYRTARGESWIRTETKEAARSRCPCCHHQLGSRDLVPFVSWAITGGRCRYCHQKISIRYPLVEVAGGFILAGVWAVSQSVSVLIALACGLPFMLAATLLVFDKVLPPLYMVVVTIAEMVGLIYVFAAGANSI